MATEDPTADQPALLDLILRGCREIDRRDPGLLRSLYHPDTIEDHGAMFCGGFKEFIAQIGFIWSRTP